jgi:predicted Fe-Mo cluster-binding NifX family protein
MKIAVPLTNDRKISDHFGQSDYFGIYTVSDKREITSVQSFDSEEGCGCKSDIAEKLAADGVSVMLASGMGGGAYNKFTRNGIAVMRGWSGSVDEVITEFLSGKVVDLGSSCHKHATSSLILPQHSHHHHHEHDHDHNHNHAHSCGCGTEGHSCGCN